MQTNFDAGDPTRINSAALREIAARLDRQKQTAASAQMRSLVDALERDGGRVLGLWANVDVFSVFSVSELARALNPQGWFSHGIEGFRNVGIFAPLLLTWWRLSSIPAGIEFKDAILGVGGEIFAVLFGLVVLSLFSEVIERGRTSRIAVDEKHFTHLLRPVSLHLSSARAGQPAELIEQFRNMSVELQREMTEHYKNLQSMTAERHQEIADLRLLNGTLTGQMSSMKSVSEVTSRSVEKVQSSISDLQQHTERLINNENNLTIQMRNMAEELATVAEKHQAGASSFEKQTEALGRSVHTFDAAMDQIGKLLPTLMNTTSGLNKMHIEFLDRISAQSLAQQDFTEKLEVAAAGMSAAAPQIARVSAAVDEIRRETGRLADKIDQSNQSAGQMVYAMNAVAKTHESAAQRFDAQTTSLGSAILTLQSSLQSLDGALPGLVGAADGIGKMHVHFLEQMADLMLKQQDFAGDLGFAVQEMKGVSPTFDKISLAVDSMREQVRILNDQLGQTSQDTANSMRKIDVLATAQTSAADTFRTVVAGQSDLVHSLEQTQTQLVQVAAQVEIALRRVDSAQGDFQMRFQTIVDKEEGVFDSLKSALDVTRINGTTIVDLGKQLVDTRNSLNDFNKRLVSIVTEMITVQDQMASLKERAGRP